MPTCAPTAPNCSVRPAQYESMFLLCYLRGPAGIIVALAEQIGDASLLRTAGRTLTGVRGPSPGDPLHMLRCRSATEIPGLRADPACSALAQGYEGPSDIALGTWVPRTTAPNPAVQGTTRQHALITRPKPCPARQTPRAKARPSSAGEPGTSPRRRPRRPLRRVSYTTMLNPRPVAPTRYQQAAELTNCAPRTERAVLA